MFSALVHIALFVPLLGLVSAASFGARQSTCYGFRNGNGYNVELVYEFVQQQSISSICNNFATNWHKQCAPPAVNCATQTIDGNNKVIIGVLDTIHLGSADAFNCAQTVFNNTMQATIIGGATAGCVDVPRGASNPSKRSYPLPLAKRDISSGQIPNLDDTIKILSGVTLTLDAIELDLPASDVSPGFTFADAEDAVTEIANQLGNTATNLAERFIEFSGQGDNQENLYFLDAEYDTGLNQGAGAMDVQDWTAVSGSALALMAQKGFRRARLIFASGGAALLAVTYSVIGVPA
ncbi:hypothetical protein B7463_g2587, partial [Scytalidium lignicola]